MLIGGQSDAAADAHPQAWVEYAATQDRLVGFNPWHMDNREVGRGAHG